MPSSHKPPLPRMRHDPIPPPRWPVQLPLPLPEPSQLQLPLPLPLELQVPHQVLQTLSPLQLWEKLKPQ
jgi:hypothetical protein